jgi:hypothetical protein
MMRHFFRPSILIALSAAVVVGALVVIFQGPPSQGRPTPLPVAPQEMEIVWLYAATNASSWERFVTAVKRTAERRQSDHPGLQADTNAAFPQQTTAVPQVSLSWSGPGPRFVFRWYKLTSDWKTRDWIEALLKRRPPPLAIIAGSSSDNAREVAAHLNRLAQDVPVEDRPLLLLTTATADRVAPYAEDEKASKSDEHPRADGSTERERPRGVLLTRLYPERTFRFCFTNRQMALAVSNFIWSRDDLRPDKDPVYMAMWNDDSYSRDLIDGFWRALRQVVAQDLANQWAWTTSQVVAGTWVGGIFPVQRLPLNQFNPHTASRFRLEDPPRPHVIDSSVGSFGTPNRYEAKVADDVLDVLQFQAQHRPLLIVSGQAQPSRRFLRGLIRAAPALAGPQSQVVVATGDAISFNTVYRDRQVAWNIQDLPFPLVFFCHHNPTDPDAGFRPGAEAGGEVEENEPDSTAATGTEDVLLFGDIVEALLQTGAPPDGSPCANAADLTERLARVRLHDDRIVSGQSGIPLFDRVGQRQSGTGEHVVCLQPMWDEDFRDRLLPRAKIEVWAWRRRDWGRQERGQHWQRCGEPLAVFYSDTRMEGGGPHGGR